MTLSEKVAYLKGVAEGLKFDPEKSPEGKLISIMMDILEHLALNAEENDDSIQALADQLDDVSDSLAMVEDYVYSDDFTDLEDEDDEEDDDAEEALEALEEDGFFELECPNCGDTLMIDESVLEEGVIQCPGCKQKFALDLSDDCCCGDGDEDGCGCGCEEHDHD